MLPMNLVPFYNLTAYRASDGASADIDLRGVSSELIQDPNGFAEAVQDLLNTFLPGGDVISTLTHYSGTQSTVRQVDPTQAPEEPTQ